MNKILIYILVIITISMQLFANEIESISISESGIIRVSFDEFPIEYQTRLSDDKKHIQVILSQVISPAIFDEYKIAKKIGLTSSEVSKDTLIFGFDTEIGYTAPALPYSNSILIETFKWQDLTKSQDLYRTALLAYEDDIITSAISDLKPSLNSGEVNAAAYLGFISMKRGHFDTAEQYFLFAESKKSDIYEIYAALASIYTARSDSVMSDVYLDLYKSNSYKSTTPHDWIMAASSQDTTSLATHSRKLIFNKVNHLANDEKFDLDSADTTESDFLADSYGDNSLLFEWLLYAAVFAGIIILYVYFKWRNEQMKRKNNANKATANKVKKTNFDDKLKSAAKANEIAKLKAKKIYSEAKSSKETTEPDKESNKSKTSEEILLEALKKNKKYFDKKMRADSASKHRTELSAKAQLALHLAEEQQKIKSQSFEKINNKNVDLSPAKLSEISKKLGIEKGGLETKIALNKYINSKEGLKKLADKFGNNDDKS